MLHLTVVTLVNLPIDLYRRPIAGLPLIDRACRLALTSDSVKVFLFLDQNSPPELRDYATSWIQSNFSPDIELICGTIGDLENILNQEVHRTQTAVVKSFDVTTVMDRGLYKDAYVPPLQSVVSVTNDPSGQPVLHVIDLLATSGTLASQHALFRPSIVVDKRWSCRILDLASAKNAEDQLWLSCRKDQDGIVARHLNRSLSLAASRLLAPTWVTPNHISFVTFSLGILAGLLAALGGPWGFGIAGLVFQANSVIDGIDGELARVRYEFSLLGEWLDTLSDDLSDIFFWAGLGVGAWRTFGDNVLGVSSDTWLILGIIAIVGKLVSMVLYYTWLAKNKRGDLLAFDWAFEKTDETAAKTNLAKLLHVTRYLFRKDFIVFFAMVLGLFQLLPYLLFAAAPGNLIVAISVAIQRMKEKG